MSLICMEDPVLLGITLKDYKMLCQNRLKLEHFFLEKAYAGFLAAQQRIIAMMTSDTKARCQQLIDKFPLLVQRVPKSHHAAYLGVSRETLCRLS